MEPGIIWITVVILRLIHDTLTRRAGATRLGGGRAIPNATYKIPRMNARSDRHSTGKGGFGFSNSGGPCNGLLTYQLDGSLRDMLW